MKPIVEQLMQLRALKREIELERGRIARLRALAAYGCRSGEVVQGGDVSDRTAKYGAEIAYLTELIRQNMQRAICELLRIQQFIDTIPNAELRCIFKLRYIKGLSWQKIAFEMNEYDEQLMRKKHDRYLKKIADTPAADALFREQRLTQHSSGQLQMPGV